MFASDNPRWEPVHHLLRNTPVDGIVTYQQLSTALGREFTSDRSPLYDAVRRLEREDSRTVENVRGIGYRVVRPVEHERLAFHHQLKARRQIVRSRDRLVSADRTSLDPEVARRFDTQAARLDTLAAMTRRNSKRLHRLEEATRNETRRRKEETAALEERLARLEQAVAVSPASLADF